MVKAWKENVVIPTYEAGAPEKNPIFLEKRVYQGSSGVVYPYFVIESIADEKTPHTYEAVFMENDYIKVMVLPGLGGRIQMAYDKIKQRHFIYYNHVIKPALVGLAGPWISGGIEFNWPQHHRPSTFMAVDCTIEEHDDSVTVWINERERMFHQQGQAGFTLRDGCAYLEVKGRVYNPTEMPQTFLWWANPAVAVNDDYQSVFPPDVNAVFDHGKRAVSSFPIATGTYYKMDYSSGVDISNYRNIKVPTSYMIAQSKYDFEGGYENDTHGGMLHVADHHFSPGKKQWTWGNGDFGRAWDRNLTDEDGPYIELMAGVFTENQPDFSWLMPYEEKSFVQYFMPYRELGIVKNASKDFIVNVTEKGMMVFATSRQQVHIRLYDDSGKDYFCDDVTLSPEQILTFDCDFDDEQLHHLHLSIVRNGREVLSWHAEPDEIRPIPDAAEAALKPDEVKTNEQLYLTGLHLEQYRHATWSAKDYYEEALRRDPLDVRCNNAMGLWYIRRCRPDKAEPYLRTAVKVLQKRNPNPYDGEPMYNLGLALKYQGCYAEAYDCFYKSTWNKAWQDAGFMSCAQISTMCGDYERALYEVEQALIYGWHNHKARALKAYLLLHTVADNMDVSAFMEESLRINPFNYGVLFELGRTQEMRELMHGDINNYDELALDYMAAGLYREASSIWQLAIDDGVCNAMTFYYMAWADYLAGQTNKTAYEKASRMSPYFINPNRIEAVLALEFAKEQTSSDYIPYYLLGNLFYDKRQYDLARENWEQAAEHDKDFRCPSILRNLALLYYNKEHDSQKAELFMQRAYDADESDARILMEYDQLLKRLGRDLNVRLHLLESHSDIVAQRDDLVLEHATILNQLGRYLEAKDIIDHHIFHPWEGGEGKVSGQYQMCRIELAKQNLRSKEAITLLEECLRFPASLGEGKLFGAQDNDIYYWLGEAYHLQGDETMAERMWQLGTVGPTEPAAALYYNDAKPEKIFFAGLCWRALGDEDKARGLFYKLINYGKQHYFDQVTMDYFAVSLPDLLVWEEDLTLRNRRHCEAMIALGEKGLKGDKG